MMKKMLLLITTLLLFFIESILLTKFAVRGVTIPLTFIFGLAVSVVSDEWDALFMGILTGFLADMYSPNLYGLHMLLNLWIFYGVVTVSKLLRRDRNFLMALLIALFATLKYSLYFIIMKLAGLVVILNNVLILAFMVLVVGFFLLILTRLFYKSNLIKTASK